MIDQIRHAKMLHAGIMLLLKSFEMATTSRESWCARGYIASLTT
jgi:c-di-AMP phosphodiesterase-like protein